MPDDNNGSHALFSQSVYLGLNFRKPWMNRKRIERAGEDQRRSVLIRKPDKTDPTLIEHFKDDGWAPLGRCLSIRVKDVRGDIWEISQRDQGVAQVGLTFVEVVIA